MNWRAVLNVLLLILLGSFLLNNLQYARSRGYGGFELFVAPAPLKEENRDTEKGVTVNSPAPRLMEETGSQRVAEDSSDQVKRIQPEEGDGKKKPPQVAQREGFSNPLVVAGLEMDSATYLSPGSDDQVKQGNYYTNNWNTPNFQSNVLNLKHFFKRNASPNKATMIHREALGGPEQPGACYNKTASADQPDIWKYKGELPMNGGPFLDGVFGYNDGNDLFASYQNRPLTPQTSSCRDDIRTGMGIPSQRAWRNQ